MKEEFKQYADALQALLGLEYSPVAVSCVDTIPTEGGQPDKKVRICRAILEAGGGAELRIAKENNACFGASWHLGFHKIKDPRVAAMVKKFVVEGEKLFCSYSALDTLMTQMDEPEDNEKKSFLLSPLEKATTKPDIVIFIVNPDQACRLLTFITFFDGRMPQIKIGGPTCRLAIIYPLQKKEVNISFYDYTARRMCAVQKDKLLVSIPYERIPAIVESINVCSAGTAKIEFPPEFRTFLQKRLHTS